MIDNTPGKGALCDNGNVVIVPSWVGFLTGQLALCDSLLPWLRDLSSSTMSVADFINRKRYGLFLAPSVEFSQEMKEYDVIIARGRKWS